MTAHKALCCASLLAIALIANSSSLAQQKKITFNTLFDLSQINEKTSLEQLLLVSSPETRPLKVRKIF
jgi:hypothetical protein